MKDEGNPTVERLEGYWRDYVLSFPWTTDLGTAVVASYPKLPYYEPNHAANINVDLDEAEDLLDRVTKSSCYIILPLCGFECLP